MTRERDRAGAGPGSIVLALDLPSGGRVRTTWTAPSTPGRGWAWVQHGFARNSSRMRGIAGLLASLGYAVVCPDIPSVRPVRSMHDTRWLTEVSVTIARAVESGIPAARGVDADGPWTFVGHSAGAAVVVHAAACMDARQAAATAAMVLLDPVDTVGGLLAASLPAVSAGPGHVVHACRPSRCNRHGVTVGFLDGQGWPVIEHPGLAHPDPERIPARPVPADVEAPSPLLARICGTPGTAAAVIDLADQVRTTLGPEGAPPPN